MPADDDIAHGVPEDEATDDTALAPPGSIGGGNQPPHQGAAGNDTAPLPRRGDRIGPYVLIDKLGAGTFGEVWKAEQKEPVRRSVAMKILHAGFNSVAVVGRFRAEQQALAMMDHPGIAKVFDAGITPSGLPYFVMQYVKGDTLLSYCDRERMPLKQRLELFALICDAVHHAHQKGIIHRDLKPQNIVVTTTDTGEAQPVVVDFGVAKALTQPLTDATAYSVLGGPQGTWAYMSPEQAEGLADIDTRSDIYSLGVVLYELLSGVRPFDDETFKDASDEAKRKVIREKEPTSPGAKVESDTTGTGTRVAESRGTHVRELAKTLRGELGWIPLFAMRKERKQRYNSAADFAEDVRNHLEGKPLKAGPLTTAYRAEKFVRRNRLLVGATAAVMASLAVGLGVAYWQSGVAKERAAEAESALARERAEKTRADSAAKQAQILDGRLKQESYAFRMQRAIVALENREFELAREHINDCPPEQRGWEWGWLEGQADQSVRAIPLAGIAWLQHASFSPDCKRLATTDGTSIQVWDTSSGASVDLRGHSEPIISVYFSNDGSRVITASYDATARVWNLEAKSNTALVGHTDTVWSGKFDSSGSRAVTASMDDTARVWDLATGASVELKGHTDHVYSATFSPDGSRVVTASGDKTARVWDVITGATIVEFKGHTDEVYSAFISSDGSHVVTASGDKTARVWDIATGASVKLGGLSGNINSAEFSPDGSQVVTASSDGTTLIWDLPTGASAKLVGHSRTVVSARFNAAASHVLTVSHDCTARVWDLSTGSSIELRGHSKRLRAAAVAPDGARAFTTSDDLSIREWDLTRQASLTRPGSRLSGSPLSPDGSRVLLRSLEGIPAVWDLTTGASTELRGHSGRVLAATFSLDGLSVATAADDGTARVWNIVNGTHVELKGHRLSTRFVDFSPDGSHVITSSNDGTSRIWRIADGSSVKVLDPRSFVNSAKFSGDGRRASTLSGDRTLQIWNLSTDPPEVEAQIKLQSDRIFAISPDWSRVVTTSEDGSASVRTLIDDTTVDLKGHEKRIAAVKFSNRGERVVTASEDGTARVWDLGSGGSIEINGRAGGLGFVSWSPDDSRVVTVSELGRVAVWDTSTGAGFTIEGDGSGVFVAEFSRDGTRIVTYSQSATVRVHDCIPNRIRYAERQANARGEDGSRIVQQWIDENLAPGFGKPAVKPSP